MSIFETTSIVFAFLLSYFGVEYFRRWCLKRKIIDIPNERSSHSNPTPRGGGIVIVFITLIFYVGYSQIFNSTNWSYVGGAIAISAISWLDDLVSIKPYWRFLVHSFAAIIAILRFEFYWNSEFKLGIDSSNIFMDRLVNKRI
jgi:Fuc2NAc and GlcNAc transferase